MRPDPTEHFWWLAGRASGLLAILLMSASVLLGLALASGLFRRPSLARAFTALHEQLAVVGLVAIGLHGVTLLGDPWLRPGLEGITLPFAIDYRPAFVAAGIAGGYSAAALGLSYYARRRLGAKRWRNAHRFIVIAWALSLVHALGAGTDAALPAVRWALLAPVPLALVLLGARIARARSDAQPAGAVRPAPARRSSAPEPQRVPVAAVDRLTDDSALVTLAVPEHLRETFRFTQGQHLPVRARIDGQLVRRHYSICSPATSDELRIAVRRVPGGVFSTYATQALRAGDELELYPPAGSFSSELDPARSRHYVAFAAGSGITPILSILATTLEIERRSRFTLVYGNRTRASTMFRGELERLATRYPGRLEVLHVLSRERSGADPLSCGHIDRDKVDTWLAGAMRPDRVDEWFLCGPLGMVETVHEALIEAGADPADVHLELFSGAGRGNEAPSREQVPCTVTLRLDGDVESFDLDPGKSILEGALDAGADPPYACMGGACGECRAMLSAGAVAMNHDFALQQAELDAGYVLPCQSHPTSPSVTLDYGD